ncbi:hypothetical protein DPMN_084409 [Dreissena polymorpha]|uniref:Fibrinogen C-terminal domain-containing protein n=2 Tax=Dreissena polymorpha TaxID=45954 RepID=A0A9D3YBR1_DREPO|nr:hypothetical protein DPMN_084409 [Dreissena polymorpha]
MEQRMVEDIRLLMAELKEDLESIRNMSDFMSAAVAWNRKPGEDVVSKTTFAHSETPIGQQLVRLKRGFSVEKRFMRSVESQLKCHTDSEIQRNMLLSEAGNRTASYIESLITTVNGFSSVKKDVHEIKTILETRIGNKVDEKDNAFTDCLDLLRHGYTSNGVYSIHPTSVWRPLQVYCDQTTAGGGWTVIQRRQDGSENFTRPWIDYAYGFGSLQGEFWLGNEFIHRLTTTVPNELRIELQDFENDCRVAEYGRFVVGPESDLYRSSIKFFSGNVTDSFSSHNGMQFSAADSGPSKGCAVSYKGGFWYDKCHLVNINGLYLKGKHDSDADGVNWHGFRGHHYSLKFSEMKIRPH